MNLEFALCRCFEWENDLQEIGWKAPINLPQAASEMTEALEATTREEEISEIGDLLQIIFRYAYLNEIDLSEAVMESLDRNRKRTLCCIDMNGGRVPIDPKYMSQLWKAAKLLEQQEQKQSLTKPAI